MAEVAARLGVAKPTLYQLAGSQDDLVRACVETEAERLLGHLHERVRGDDAARRARCGRSSAYAADSPGGFRAALRARRGRRRGGDAAARDAAGRAAAPREAAARAALLGPSRGARARGWAAVTPRVVARLNPRGSALDRVSKRARRCSDRGGGTGPAARLLSCLPHGPKHGILVIGGGIAGQAVCEAVRERDPDVPITLRLRRAAAALRPRARSSQPARRRARRRRRSSCARTSGTTTARVDVRLGARVDGARPRRRHVRARRRHARCAFDRAVLCTGSDALVPPIPGIDLRRRPRLPRARGLRGDRRRRRAARARAAVIGGGLLGLEAARGARRARLPDDRRAPRRPPDGAPARRRRGGAARARRWRRSASRCCSSARPSALLGDATARRGPALRRRRGARLRPRRRRDRHPAAGRPGARAPGLDVERGDRRRRPPGHVAPARPRRRRVRPAPRRRPRHRRADPRAGGGRGGDARRRATPRYAGSVPSAKLKVMGVDLVTVGAAEGEREVVGRRRRRGHATASSSSTRRPRAPARCCSATRAAPSC